MLYLLLLDYHTSHHSYKHNDIQLSCRRTSETAPVNSIGSSHTNLLIFKKHGPLNYSSNSIHMQETKNKNRDRDSSRQVKENEDSLYIVSRFILPMELTSKFEY